MENPSNFHIKSGKEFEVKDLFVRISDLIKGHFKNTHDLSILDIGCAAGELPYYLKSNLNSNKEAWGVDIGDKLISNANARFGDYGCKFKVGDAVNFNLSKKFDVVTATSVMSYFEDVNPFLKNFLHHLDDKGIGIITGIFNDHNFHVKLSYRRDEVEDWNHGFNQVPISYVQKKLLEYGYQSFVYEQIMPFDIKTPENKLRSWSVNLNGIRHNTNGLGLVWNIKLLKIIRKN